MEYKFIKSDFGGRFVTDCAIERALERAIPKCWANCGSRDVTVNTSDDKHTNYLISKVTLNGKTLSTGTFDSDHYQTVKEAFETDENTEATFTLTLDKELE